MDVGAESQMMRYVEGLVNCHMERRKQMREKGKKMKTVNRNHRTYLRAR
jgi:hypothetical protein